MSRSAAALAAAVVLSCHGVTAQAAGQAAGVEHLTGKATTLAWPSLSPGYASITESLDRTTINDDVNCGGFSGSSFYRSFQLSAFPALDLPKFKVESVTFGVYLVSSNVAGGSVPGHVAVYSSSATPPTLASLTLLDSADFSAPVSFAVLSGAALPNTPVMDVATDTLVVEVSYQNNPLTNSEFFIGGNDAGQSAPSYMRAPDCQFDDIVDIASLGPGFDQFSVLIAVNGVTQASTPVVLQSFEVR